MINNIEFKAYVKNTIAFARTIVIKCNDIALSDNRLMEQHYGLNSGVDPAKWRYYMNLNGEYHVTDQMMYVQSLDNGDTIEFTKANLDLHLATKRAYREGSYYYSRLVEKYPAQSILINGVINPIPQSESVPAKDYSILRYNKDYVEWNEYQLIPALQKHIDAMVLGSFDTEYLYTDNLMLPLLIATLHGSLVSNIMMLRKEAATSRYAHSFYIWSRLQSVGISSVYKKYLDRKQTMWLFRNIDYVLRKLGRRATFDDVLDILLTHRRIPLSRYETIQTTEDMETTFVPKPMMISTPINMINEFGMDTRIYTVPEVLKKEDPLAIDNESNYEQGESDTSYAIKFGLFGDVPSKVLESNMTDTTDRNPDRLMRVLHNEWIYLTFNGRYNINIDVPDVRSGSKVRLTMPQAIILWHYLIDRSRGCEPKAIPEYNYWHVRKLVDPTWQELQKLGGKEILSEDTCKNILKVQVDFPNLITPDGFFNKCKEVQDAMWEHKKLYSRILNLFYATRRKNAVDACYADGLAKFGNWATYDDFLLTLDLDVWTYNQDECLDMAWAIWSKATGWEFNDVQSIGEQQRMLINLMKDLTSYTVQYVGSTETLEGQFNMPYMLLMDGDHIVGDGETSLVHDPGAIYIPIEFHGTVEASLPGEPPIGQLPGPNWGVSDAELYGSAKIPMEMNLYPIEYKPAPFNSIISNALTLREVKY